jgi:fatty acid desaturase
MSDQSATHRGAALPALAEMAPRFLLFPILALIGQLAVMAYGPSLPLVWQILAIAGVGYFWFNVAGSFHEVVHHTLFRSEAANVWLGRMIGSFVAIPYTAYKESHRLHHAYLNTPQDTELWPYSDPSWSRRSRLFFAWADILISIILTPIIYGRVYWMRNSPLKPQTLRTIRREYLGLLAAWGTAIGASIWLVRSGRIDGAAFHPLWLSPLAISMSLNTIRKFTEHLGMESLDPVLGTRTVIGPSLITRLSSYFNFDIYVHGPHHRYPRAQHTELPVRLRELQSEAAEPIPVFPTYRAAMLDMFPCLFRNPGVGANATPR